MTAVVISQKYEFFPTLGMTVGRHVIKPTATRDTITVRPLLASNLPGGSAMVVKSASTTPTVTSTSVLTFATAVPTAGDKVIVGGITYTFIANAGTPTSGAFEVRLGANVTGTGNNLVKAINNSGATAGTEYSAGGFANPFVTATDGSAGVVNLVSSVQGYLGFIGATPSLKMTTPANGVVTTLPVAGVGPFAQVTSTTTGVVTLLNCVSGDQLELITYHSGTDNYTAIG